MTLDLAKIQTREQAYDAARKLYFSALTHEQSTLEMAVRHGSNCLVCQQAAQSACAIRRAAENRYDVSADALRDALFGTEL